MNIDVMMQILTIQFRKSGRAIKCGGGIYSYDGVNHSSNHNTATIYYSRYSRDTGEYILLWRCQPLQQPQRSYHLLLQVLQGYRGIHTPTTVSTTPATTTQLPSTTPGTTGIQGNIYSFDGVNHSSNHNTATVYYSRYSRDTGEYILLLIYTI